MNLQDISDSFSTPQFQALLLNDQESSQSSSFYNPPYNSVTNVAVNEQQPRLHNAAMVQQQQQPSSGIDEGTLLCQVLRYLLELNKQQELAQMNVQEQMSMIPQQVQLTSSGNHEDCDGQINADVLPSQLNSSRASVASSSSSPLAFYSPLAVASPSSSTVSLSFPSAPLSPDSYSSQVNQESNQTSNSVNTIANFTTNPLNAIPPPPNFTQQFSMTPSHSFNSNILPLTRYSSSSSSTGAAIPSSSASTSSTSTSSLVQKASFGYPTWLAMSSSHMEAISHNRQAAKDLLQSPAQPKHKRTVSETRTQPQVSAALLLHLLDEAKRESGIENGREKRSKHAKHSR